ncbi:conserved Plasmodium protein, unknown function [Plasmodium yoelii]|nr:conserved Plasmodium protein, unknown function [Plasmodium yoelii]CDU20118.1 conserved Plasmodium protein, unknown function [Plasmodium yoelii]VTZ80876.1 conserved Plasmodium protein, unknown function [Plasmodium yoelii]|eukprot:XP_724437.2 conserved Plasmodium protein, unknown function [Plasmodium yoelii]
MTKASYSCMVKCVFIFLFLYVIQCINNKKSYFINNFMAYKRCGTNNISHKYNNYYCDKLKEDQKNDEDSCLKYKDKNINGYKIKQPINILKAHKIDQKEIKRKKNYQYAMKHMYDKNGRRIKEINKERKSLKKKNIFDYEGFKVNKIFTCLSDEDMEELRDEELKRKSGEILHNNKYIDTYGVESDSNLDQI